MINFAALIKYALLVLFSLLGGLLKGQLYTATDDVGDSLLVKQLLLASSEASHQDSSFNLAENAFLLANKINFHKGKYQAAQLLADYYDQQGNISAALRYNIIASVTLKKIANPLLTIRQLIRVGEIYDREKLYTNALVSYQQARQIAKQYQLTQELIPINNLVGAAHSNNNQADSAFFYYQKNVLFFTDQQQQTDLIKTYQKIVFNFLKQKNYNKSLAYNLKIKKLLEEDKKPERLAIIYNNIGYDYNAIKAYDKAITYFQLVDSIDTKGSYIPKATLYKHLGIAFHNKQELSASIAYFKNAKKALPKTDKKGEAELNYLLASIFLNADDLYNALRYNTAAENIASKIQDARLLVNVYKNAATINQLLYDYELAFNYYQKHLSLRDSFELEERLLQEKLLQEQSLVERAEKEIKLLLINQDVQNLQISQLGLEKEKLELAADNLALESVQQKNELDLLKSEQKIKETNLKNEELQTLRAKQALALVEKNLETEQQQREISDLHRIEAEQQLELKQKEANEKEQAQKIRLLNQQQEIDKLELDRQAVFRRFAYGVGGLLLLILSMILIGLFYARRVNKQLGQQKEIIEIEKNKSDNLLLNILPAETANELKEKGKAAPKVYDSATVLFTDFSGFTRISMDMTPEALLEELNAYFIAFDEICQQHNMEKIKTIGDAYMCVGGLPKPNVSHPIDAVNAAIAMLRFHQKRLKQKQAQGIPYWDMRLGMHTGRVVAGVVGKNKFAYDIWGDTVNTASRMESSAELGRINISDSTYHLIADAFDCTYRGEISVKNRGKVAMYFVNL